MGILRQQQFSVEEGRQKSRQADSLTDWHQLVMVAVSHLQSALTSQTHTKDDASNFPILSAEAAADCSLVNIYSLTHSLSLRYTLFALFFLFLSHFLLLNRFHRRCLSDTMLLITIFWFVAFLVAVLVIGAMSVSQSF